MFGYETKLDRYFRKSEEELRQHRTDSDAHREEARTYAEEVQAYHQEVKAYREESQARQRRADIALEEAKEFNREILLRNEKVYTGVIRRLEELGEESRKVLAETRWNTDETKAQTQALLRVIDRLDAEWGKPDAA